MSISHYIKEIGRGRDGARPLDRLHAADLFGRVLDRRVSDLEIGAFCVAMRIKGETAEEMAGFIDATRERMTLVPAAPTGRPTVVLPSYNGARKFPVLTPLLAQCLVNAGCRVIVHGMGTQEPGRTTSAQVLQVMGVPMLESVADVQDERINYLPIAVLSPALHRLLEVRYTVGLRNSAHSLVKIINPCATRALVVGSYTHAEYLHAMNLIYREIAADALLLRGIEGESVADGRRVQAIDAYIGGLHQRLQEAQTGRITQVPDWPQDVSAPSTARYIQAVLAGDSPLPDPIQRQVVHIQHALRLMQGV